MLGLSVILVKVAPFSRLVVSAFLVHVSVATWPPP
jgi:hypothetical protein